jgi:hypothetical protein
MSDSMSDSALLRSGTIPPGQKGLEFNSLISPAWGDYELTLRGIFPAPFQNQPGYVLLFMHLSNDNGATWDTSSCHDIHGQLIQGCKGANYSFCNSFTVPGGATVHTRNPGQGALDEEFEITQQSAHPSGVSGSIRFYNALANGIYKQFRWDTSYFGPDNFCCESGAGVYYGPNMSGSPFNAFRLIFASPGADPTYVAFGGGDYSLWAYK